MSKEKSEMVLEKDQYKEIANGVYICYVAKWGSELNKAEYLYAIATECKYDDNVLEIWGYGSTIQNASLMACENLFLNLSKSIDVGLLKDFNVLELIEEVKENGGFYCSSEFGLRIDEKENEHDGSIGYFEMSIILENGKCYPLRR